MTDRSTKALLAIIAAGMWVNILAPAFGPIHAAAQTQEPLVSSIARDVSDIKTELAIMGIAIDRIARGGCLNPKLC